MITGTEYLTGDQLRVMTLEQIESARARGKVDPSRSVACQIADHAPRCKGRVVGIDWTATPCQCECHR